MVCHLDRGRKTRRLGWWNEEVQESIRRKRLAKKKWESQRDDESRQEYKEMWCKAKREAKGKAYGELYERLDIK